MVFANIALMTAPIAHLNGHYPQLGLQAFVIGPSETWHRLVICISQWKAIRAFRRVAYSTGLPSRAVHCLRVTVGFRTGAATMRNS